MKTTLTVAALVIAALAPRAAHADRGRAAVLHTTAQTAARHGSCQVLGTLARQIAAEDPAYYAEVYETDPVITGCVAAKLEAERTVAAAVAATPGRRDAPASDELSPNLAFGLSLGITALSVGLLAEGIDRNSQGLVGAGLVGIAVGPTTGHIYAGHTWNRYLGARVVSLVAGALGAGLASRCLYNCRGADNMVGTTGAVLLLGSALTYVGATLGEIGSAPSAARRTNRERASLAVAPVVDPNAGQAGVVVAGSF